MSKDPAVSFYPSDFLAATMLWTHEQVGRYIRLLCLQQNQGHLTQLAIDTIAEGDELVISKFIQDENGLWYNTRMEDEVTKRRSYSASRSANRRGSAKSDENQMVSENKPNGLQNESKCETYENHMSNISSTYESHMSNTSQSYEKHMGIGNGIGNRNDNSISNTSNTNNTNKYYYGNVPSIEEINQFCVDNLLSIDTQKFYDYYNKCNWTIGGQPIQDWRAIVKKWASRQRQPAPQKATDRTSSFDLEEAEFTALKKSHYYDNEILDIMVGNGYPRKNIEERIRKWHEKES